MRAIAEKLLIRYHLVAQVMKRPANKHQRKGDIPSESGSREKERATEKGERRAEKGLDTKNMKEYPLCRGPSSQSSDHQCVIET